MSLLLFLDDRASHFLVLPVRSVISASPRRHSVTLVCETNVTVNVYWAPRCQQLIFYRALVIGTQLKCGIYNYEFIGYKYEYIRNDQARPWNG